MICHVCCVVVSCVHKGWWIVLELGTEVVLYAAAPQGKTGSAVGLSNRMTMADSQSSLAHIWWYGVS